MAAVSFAEIERLLGVMEMDKAQFLTESKYVFINIRMKFILSIPKAITGMHLLNTLLLILMLSCLKAKESYLHAHS
ncbi:hypothetical protein OCE25_27040 [Bacillus cereus]|nr:hypothetical protein [Bacillus cereus]